MIFLPLAKLSQEKNIFFKKNSVFYTTNILVQYLKVALQSKKH